MPTSPTFDTQTLGQPWNLLAPSTREREISAACSEFMPCFQDNSSTTKVRPDAELRTDEARHRIDQNQTRFGFFGSWDALNPSQVTSTLNAYLTPYTTLVHQGEGTEYPR